MSVSSTPPLVIPELTGSHSRLRSHFISSMEDCPISLNINCVFTQFHVTFYPADSMC